MSVMFIVLSKFQNGQSPLPNHVDWMTVKTKVPNLELKVFLTVKSERNKTTLKLVTDDEVIAFLIFIVEHILQT